jgi:BirA family transcriptional regulator, biotin operon repressor / biotin---[acetyl-CoA-carboxylase] ligase
MDESLIRSGLRSPDHFQLHVFEEIDSTNSYLLELGKRNLPEWTMAVSEMQTRGRGRLDRSWESPSGVGLWFSILLRPNIRPEDCHLVNLLGAVSLADYLERYISNIIGKELNIGLKWPNDLFSNGRKLSGILLQSNISSERTNLLVLGIGLNVNQTKLDFPHAIREKAISLRMLTNREWNREELLAGFLEYYYENYYRYLPKKREEIIELYMKKLLYVDQKISINLSGETVTGVIRGLTAQGYLIIQNGGGERIITTGEIS